ncbi:MAG TPA: bile acid:sodium symporter family protein [Saprospiraceae bacterium]|nr:bile acid:sodium symporter family protein [Saprospiraceae bacterium]
MDIDAIRINFNSDQLFILNICLAFLMFGVALDIKLVDFKNIFKKPKAPIVGLVSQLLLLPILTLLLIYILKPPASLALGMILVASCPGGNVSNFAVHLSKANAALSVMLTSMTTLFAIIFTPISFTFLSKLVLGDEALQQSIYVEPMQMVQSIALLIFLPLVLGMFLNHNYEKLTNKIQKPVRILSMIIFLSFVVVAIISNWENIKNYLYLVFYLVLIHNSLAYVLGYSVANFLKLPKADARAISIETGIQNTGLGLILIFNFFGGLGGMALVAACWGIWHLISGFFLAMLWSGNIPFLKKYFPREIRN